MIIRSDISTERTIKRAVVLSRFKQFQLARKVLKDAGVNHRIIERVLFEPHNTRSSD